MQQPSTARGPLVWRDLDQKALDAAYDQDVYAPNRPLIVTRRIAASERARAILGEPQRVAYGPSEYERLDIFRAPAANAPVNIFIHGGAWRRNKGPDYHLQAEPLVRAGAHCVEFVTYQVQSSHSWAVVLLEVTRDRVSHHLPEAVEVVGFGDDRLADRARNIAPLGSLLDNEDDFRRSHAPTVTP